MLDRYAPELIEPKWQQRWEAADLFRTREEADRPKFYGLDFFPYPSGAGLSVGHLRNYIPTDVLCRMKRMQGFNVLHPMGWDAFGLPAELEAIKRKAHPARMIREYAETYKRQEKLVGISYDWSRELNSSDPSYYRWTQWLFLVLYRRGLAYRAGYAANWCPKDRTVLANEEVEGGLCWRCGTPVEKKILEQWFFKITDYAERLLSDLDLIDWPEGIKDQQRNWIGRSEGVEFDWEVSRIEDRVEVTTGSAPGVEVRTTSFREVSGLRFTVFTTRIDTVYGATFCVLAPEHPLVPAITSAGQKAAVEAYIAMAERLSDQDRLAAGRAKTGVFTGAYARNPFTGAHVPIYIADYVLMTYGTGAIMAVPAHDERDWAFADEHGLEVTQVIAPESFESVELPFCSEAGILVNSGEFTDLSCSNAQEAMGMWLESKGLGKRVVQYRLRDWLISRQRYWGAPIPIIYCDKCGEQAVPEDQLPVLLPAVDSYEPTSTGESPLAAIPEFVHTTCPQCGGSAKRETDTMGGFACSSWYFLRFCDPHNDEEAFSKAKVDYWMPVDCYVGGAEHAVMHLLYARFWMKVFYDAGLVQTKEPFQVLHNQGMLLAPTPFRYAKENETLKVGESGIQITYEEASKLPENEVFWKWEKMSKSKGNVVTPDEAVASYGADALRVYELFEAPFEQTIQWTKERIAGAIRFLNRIFRLISSAKHTFVKDWRDRIEAEKLTAESKKMRRCTHYSIQRVTDCIENFRFNTAVSALMEFSNELSDYAAHANHNPLVLSEAIETFLLLLAPIAPHSADEIWESLGFEGFTYLQAWPTPNPDLLEQETLTIVLQVNGKVRANVEVSAGLSDEELKQIALENEKVLHFINGKTIRKVIVVPQKLVNIVAN